MSTALYYLTFFLLLDLLVKSEVLHPSLGYQASALKLKSTPTKNPSFNRPTRWRPAFPSIDSAVEKIYAPFLLASRIVRKPIRDVNFWGKALTIYGSYKVHQVKVRVQKRLLGHRKDISVEEMHKNRTEMMWNYLHEENSKRMVNLCIGMKGFYLKTGQFLGTRHDFMPEHYTVRSFGYYSLYNFCLNF